MDAVVRLHFQSLNFWKNVIMVLFKNFRIDLVALF